MERAVGSNTQFVEWRSRLRAAKKRFQQEVRSINLNHLPLLLLSLDRYQLGEVYGRLYKGIMPARVSETAARILDYENPERVVICCEQAQGIGRRKWTRGRPPKSGQQAYRERNRPQLRAKNKFRKLLHPESAIKDREYRERSRDKAAAQRKAFWGAMTPAVRKAYIQEQWKRREARLKAQPGGWEAYNAQKREEAAARRERAKHDPQLAARLREHSRRQAERRKANRHVELERIKADPVRLSKLRKRSQRASNKHNIQRALKRPGRAAEIRAQIAALIPPTFPPELRADLCNEVYAALLSGDMGVTKLREAVKAKSAKVRRLMGDRWKQVSLHEAIQGTDGLKLIDTIEADRPHF